MRIVIFCAGLAFVSTAAVAGDKPDVKKPVDPSLKVVCKTEQVVGSKISSRTCKTRAQWEQEALDARAALDNRTMWKETKGIPGN